MALLEFRCLLFIWFGRYDLGNKLKSIYRCCHEESGGHTANLWDFTTKGRSSQETQVSNAKVSPCRMLQGAWLIYLVVVVGFEYKPIFANDLADPKNVDHFKIDLKLVNRLEGSKPMGRNGLANLLSEWNPSESRW